jgi:hypothetical protein
MGHLLYFQRQPFGLHLPASADDCNATSTLSLMLEQWFPNLFDETLFAEVLHRPPFTIEVFAPTPNVLTFLQLSFAAWTRFSTS